MRKSSLMSLGLAAFFCATALAGEKPRIAVVIDDFGLTYPKNVPDDEWMAVRWPVTFAVMPRSPRTKEAAKATLASGKELIIHFPFDPFLSLDLARGEQPSEGDREKVRALLADCLKTIPGAAGLNNHRSYKATQSRALMRWFMGEIKPRKLYFIDSKVSSKSVAYEEAKAAGVPSGINTIFLEEPRHYSKEFAMRMLRVAAAAAKKRGAAIVIGHHYYHGTYEGLLEMVPKLQAEGFEFVFASQVVR